MTSDSASKAATRRTVMCGEAHVRRFFTRSPASATSPKRFCTVVTTDVTWRMLALIPEMPRGPPDVDVWFFS